MRLDRCTFSDFAQHVLPSGFMKIRHYGWMSAGTKTILDEVKWLV
ncbi:MAG: transposase [Planctomycetota bacterium]